MHRVAYIFPLIAANILLVLFRNYDQWWIYLIMVVVTEFFLWLIMRRVSRTKEYLSGYARYMEHHEPWVERVERVESYTDSRGNTCTRVVVDYVHHPDLWLMVLNTGRVVVIHHNVYYHYCSLWKTPELWINPPHSNCVSEVEVSAIIGMASIRMLLLVPIKAYISTMSTTQTLFSVRTMSLGVRCVI